MSRERPKTENRTVLTNRGTPLRGGVVELFAYGKDTGKTAYARDPKYYRMLRRARLNALRVVCCDPWQRSRGLRGTLIPWKALAGTNRDRDSGLKIYEFLKFRFALSEID